MRPQSSSEQCELLIVGASFAGLVAARTAAMRGLSVVVLEKKPEVGSRVATTGILVKEAAEDLDIPHDLTRRVQGVRLYAPNLKFIDLFAPGYYFLTTDTGNVLRWLASEAERAGARIVYSCRFEGVHRVGNGFRVPGLDLVARYILGADGGHSAVARHFGLGRNTHFLAGAEREYAGLEGCDPRFLHCFIDRQLAPGYLAWVAPGPKVTQVGLAVTAGKKVSLDGFVAATGKLFGYSQGSIVERRAGRIPAGGLVRPWAAPGVMLIGDAAGQVSPATGGGIQLAFRFGRRAAHAIADHLQCFGPAPDAVLERKLPDFVLKKFMRSALDAGPPNVLVNALIGTPLFRALASQIYFHKRGSGHESVAGFRARLDALESERLERSEEHTSELQSQ